MSDLISRQTAMHTFLADLTKREEKNPLRTWSTLDVEYYIAKILEQLPTVDAVPVVLCKDCKYSMEHYDTDGNVPWWGCSEWDAGTDADGFCYLGERKDNEDEI